MSATVRKGSLAWHHPEWWLLALAAVAWIALVFVTAATPPEHAHAHGPPATTSSIAGAGLMSVAMMTPLALPAARYVALRSFAFRRQRAQATFVSAYLATWVVLALAISSAVEGVAALAGDVGAIVCAFALASVWQLSPPKRRALTRCRRATSFAAEGWRATRDCLALGFTHAAACAATCVCIMAAAAATGHAPPAMAALFGVQLHERLTPRYRPRASAAFLALVGVAAVMLSA